MAKKKQQRGGKRFAEWIYSNFGVSPTGPRQGPIAGRPPQHGITRGGRPEAPAPPAPPQEFHPGTPEFAGVRTPPVAPFLTAEDMIALGNAVRDFELAQQDVDNEIERQRTNNEFEKTQVDKQAQQTSSDATDAAIARGLFQSSIRDSQLVDIAATQRLKKQFLDDNLSLTATQGGARKKALQDNLDAFKDAINKRAVENAREAGKDQPEWLDPPRPEVPGEWRPAAATASSAPGAWLIPPNLLPPPGTSPGAFAAPPAGHPLAAPLGAAANSTGPRPPRVASSSQQATTGRKKKPRGQR